MWLTLTLDYCVFNPMKTNILCSQTNEAPLFHFALSLPKTALHWDTSMFGAWSSEPMQFHKLKNLICVAWFQSFPAFLFLKFFPSVELSQLGFFIFKALYKHKLILPKLQSQVISHILHMGKLAGQRGQRKQTLSAEVGIQEFLAPIPGLRSHLFWDLNRDPILVDKTLCLVCSPSPPL